MGYSLDFGWLSEDPSRSSQGAAMTVFLIAVTAVSVRSSASLGAAGGASRSPVSAAAFAGYVELIRNTPFLVQLFFIFFGLPSLGMRLIGDGGRDAGHDGQSRRLCDRDRARRHRGGAPAASGRPASALGLDRGSGVPLRRAAAGAAACLSGAVSQIVIMMLGSAVVSQIAADDLTYAAEFIQSRNFRAFETYFVVTAIYLASRSLCGGCCRGVGRRLFARSGARDDASSPSGTSCAICCSPRAGRCCCRSSPSSAAASSGC